MTKGMKSFNNFLFPLFAFAGAYVIYRQDANLTKLELLIPTFIVALYSFFISLTLRSASEAECDHYSDSIYFMGFLYTLMALATLFSSLDSLLEANESGLIVTRVFTLVGVSVTTSIAGVLFRNMVKAAFMKNQPDTEDSMKESYLLLKEIAESFSSSYSQTFQSISEYLQERQDNLKIFTSIEENYLQSLDNFTDTTNAFCNSLKQQGEAVNSVLTSAMDSYRAQAREINEYNSSIETLSDAFRRLRRDCEALPIDNLSGGFKGLAEDSRELDAVIDSIITIIDRKLEAIPV